MIDLKELTIAHVKQAYLDGVNAGSILSLQGEVKNNSHASQICCIIWHMDKMIRTNYYFPRQMLEALKAASEKHGLPISEIIRRAITEWLKCN